MRPRPSMRTRNLEFLLNNDPPVPTPFIMRAGRLRNDRVHRYSIMIPLAINVSLRQGALGFLERDIAEVLAELAELLEAAGGAFGDVGGAGFVVDDGVVGVCGVVLLPGLEELRDDDGEGAADDGADFFGDGEDEEYCYAVWRVVCMG